MSHPVNLNISIEGSRVKLDAVNPKVKPCAVV